MPKIDTQRIVGLPALLSLAGLTAGLLSLSLVEAMGHAWPVPTIVAIAILGLLICLWPEVRNALGHSRAYTGAPGAVVDGLYVLLGALATYLLNHHLQIGAVLASSLVGLGGALFFKGRSVALFCGSFVGMAAPGIFVSYPSILLAGSLSGFFFVASAGQAAGYGGRLGTIAFGGCLLTSLVLPLSLDSSPIPGWDSGWLIIGLSILGATSTYLLAWRLGHGPVTASASIGILAAVLLPPLFGPQLGTKLATAVFCASFVGMSGPERMATAWPVALAGGLCGLVFMYSRPWLCGAGGKLGTIAMASVMAICGLRTLTMGLYPLVARLRRIWARRRPD